MSEMQGNTPLSMSEKSFYQMKISFASRFRLDLNLPLFAAATCSAIPWMRQRLRAAFAAAVFMFAPCAYAQWGASGLPDDSFGDKVRQYILANPGVIRDALKLLVAEEQQTRARAAQAALAAHREFLFKDRSAPTSGNPDGDVTVVAFLDYRCPHCRRSVPTLSELVRADPNVRLVFREYPVLGPESVNAARYALAAQRQGRYAEMHQALMESDVIDAAAMATIARRAGLDEKRLEADINDRAVLQTIERTVAVAQDIGVTGTPGYVIGERLIPGAIDLQTMLTHVAEARRLGNSSR